MRFISLAVLAVLATVGPTPAADGPLAGNWRLGLPAEGGKSSPFWLIQFEDADGKVSGKIIAKASERVPPATLADVTVSDGLLRFNIKVQGSALNFEGRVPEKGKVLYGSLQLSGRLVPVELEPTKMVTLNAYDLAKEDFARATRGPEIFDAVMTLLGQAEKQGAKPEEVRSWAEKAYKAADLYGPRQQRDVALTIAEAIAGQEGLAEVAVNYARRAERALDPKDSTSTQRRVLQTLAAALKKAGKADEAKEVEGRLAKLPLVKATPFAGRKGKSERVVLMELFTGAQCPPCVAADLAFDALEKTYKPGEAIFLQYHLHIPGPDPLTNADSEARAAYYGPAVEGTPTTLFNGRPDAEGGGSQDGAQDKYAEFREVIDAELEKPAAKVKLSATAESKDGKIVIAADATATEDVTEKVRLRLALVETRVEYTGRNKLSEHHNVVRALPGGTAGVAMKDKKASQAVTVDVAELKKKLQKYLADWAKENDAFPGKEATMEMKNLRVVAFVQNDTTKEVLAAVQVEVK